MTTKQYRITSDLLNPLYKMSVGFDRLADDFLTDPAFTNASASGYPPFNINKITKTDTEEVEYLHKGIAERSFTRTFKLAEYVEVKSASLRNGILRVRLWRNIPEAAKPKLIAITS